MKNGIWIYIVGAVLFFTGCFIGGFYGGLIFGISAALLILATIGRWQYNKASSRQDEGIEKLVSVLKKASNDSTVNPGS